MTDVERVLMVLLPTLSLMSGCGKNEPPETNNTDIAQPKPEPEPQPKPEPKPEPQPEPTGETGTTQPDDPPVAMVAPPERNRPTCPTSTWCGSKADSDKIATKGKAGGGRQLGCVALVEAQARHFSQAEYSGLGPYTAFFDKAATELKRDEGAEDQCCYTWTEPCPGGRPLLDGSGTAVVAQARHCEDAPTKLAPDASAAAAWVKDAAMEHASVASFNRAALELLSVGAPLDLVRRCQEAALDELRHVETCLALARRCGATATGFGALPLPELRAPDLARLAADTFAEGCVGETVATLAMKRAAAAVAGPSVTGQLEGIASDELRHAELAWETVAWAVRTGGRDVLAAVRERADALRPDDVEPLPAPSDRRRSAATGRLDARAAALAARHAWRRIIDPMLDALQAAHHDQPGTPA